MVKLLLNQEIRARVSVIEGSPATSVLTQNDKRGRSSDT